MAKIERFEDLQSWQKARQLANVIYDLTEYSKFAKDFRLCNQIQGAAGSVMHNIDDGQRIFGSPALPAREQLQILACTAKLPAMRKQLNELERAVSQIAAPEEENRINRAA